LEEGIDPKSGNAYRLIKMDCGHIAKSFRVTKALTLVSKDTSKAFEKSLEKYFEGLRKKGMRLLSHTKGTNTYTVEFETRRQLEDALKKISNNHQISLYYSKPDHLKEVSEAIIDLDYFKAFTLCNSLYEAFGKNILVSEFRNMSLNEDRIKRLGIHSIILMLYTHHLIKEGTYSDMISVNDTRNDFVHDYMSSTQSEKTAKEIKENIPKIMRSLKTLDKINKKKFRVF
jgi:hypothetical protein